MLRRLFQRAKAEHVTSHAVESSVDRSSIAKRNLLIEEARALSRAGQSQRAIACLCAEILKAPSDPELLYAQADVLFDWGRYFEAARGYSVAENLGISHTSLALRHGWACYWSRDTAQAATLMVRASEYEAAGWAPYFGLGIIAMSRKDWASADVHFRDALRIDPGNPACLGNLANVLLQLEDYEGCVARARDALQSDAKLVAALTPLAIGLAKLGKEAEALEVFAEVLDIDRQTGNDSSGLQNYANALIESSRVNEAIALLERELRSCPSAGAYANYSIALLAAGKYVDGWSLYEYRWLKEPLLSARFELAVPVWNGQDIRGKHILIRSEQGIGDIVQFARYLPMVKALGATVHFQRRKGLDGLESTFAGIDHVIQGEVKSEGISYYANLLSLPRVFDTTLETVPHAIPYLQPDSALLEKWRKRLSGTVGLKVGIVWAGDPRHVRDRQRSIRLAELSPIFDLPNATFFSLQKGDAAEQLRLLDSTADIVDLGAEFSSYSDTAAAIAALDVVVSVDTSVAHVAAAQGIPTMLLVAIPSDFRWLDSRTDTPWYPSMQLFRQQTRGDWQTVVLDVKLALQSFEVSTREATADTGRSRSAGDSVTEVFLPTFLPHGGIDATLVPVIEGREGIFQYDRDDTVVGTSLGWYGEHLNEQIRVLTTVVSAGSWMLEIGCGVGTHSVPMSRMIGSSGHLLLSESDVATRRLLSQNLESNQVSNYTMLRSDLTRSDETTADAQTTIDSLHIQRLDWIKISTRAMASQILAGSSETLWTLRPRILASVKSPEEAQSLASFLSAHGYKCWTMTVPLFNPANFFQTSENKFDGASDIAVLAVPEEVQVDVDLPHCRPIAA